MGRARIVPAHGPNGTASRGVHPTAMATNYDAGPPGGGGSRKLDTRGKIDLGGAHDMAYWVKALDTTPEKLREAVNAVGDDAVKVTEYLKPDRGEQPPSAPQIPDGG
jgi:hypothetical protein